MRVCVVPHKYWPDTGGVAVASQRYARGLTRAGHEVSVVWRDSALPPGARARSVLEQADCLRVGPYRKPEDTLSGWFEAVVEEHRRAPFDVVVGRYVSEAAFVAVLAARFLELPVVVSARGNDLDRAVFDPAKFSGIQYTLSQASAVTCVSTELARKVVALVPTAKPRVIHNGVDLELFSPGPRDEALTSSWLPGVDHVLGFFGEARTKKGLPVLLQAYARVLEQQPRSALLLVGGVRADDAPILEVFRQQRPQAHVVVVPPQPHAELVRYYRSVSRVVLPSLRDGLPNALLEAMACGCSVIASQVGGIPEVITSDSEGWLVPPGDVDALAQALLKSLSDEPSARAQGRNARERVQREFGQERERALDLQLLESLFTAR